MSLFIVALCLFFFGAVLMLVTQNDARVDVNLLFSSYQQVSVSLIMVACLAAGVGFASLISFLDGLRLRLQNRRLRKDVGRLEGELEKRRRPMMEKMASERPATPPQDFAG
ncbi:MAG TPA: LapA family protein [Candidatus Polarisedimenticolia bacterium]|nr:LapA family protein [Candidatus Polarisedimenticolia bacterium]